MVYAFGQISRAKLLANAADFPRHHGMRKIQFGDSLGQEANLILDAGKQRNTLPPRRAGQEQETK
jgi:hypothetical protein